MTPTQEWLFWIRHALFDLQLWEKGLIQTCLVGETTLIKFSKINSCRIILKINERIISQLKNTGTIFNHSVIRVYSSSKIVIVLHKMKQAECKLTHALVIHALVMGQELEHQVITRWRHYTCTVHQKDDMTLVNLSTSIPFYRSIKLWRRIERYSQIALS